mgnify:CR=1 FL=1
MKFIKYNNVYKFYESFCALKDVSFEIKAHGVHALLGPNGAGKTSTINCLIRKEFQDLGSIQSTISSTLINYLPEDPPLIEDVKVIDYLNFCRSLKSQDQYLDMYELIERLELSAFKHKIISNLSKGNKQKVNLVQAFMGRPKLIILDEPNTNIDPKIIRVVRTIIEELKSKVSFLISSHQLLEVDAVADEITILSDGKVLFTGNKLDLLGSQKQIHFLTDNKIVSEDVLKFFRDNEITKFSQSENWFIVDGVNESETTEFIKKITSKLEVTEIYSKPLSLEQAYFKEFPL